MRIEDRIGRRGEKRERGRERGGDETACIFSPGGEGRGRTRKWKRGRRAAWMANGRQGRGKIIKKIERSLSKDRTGKRRGAPRRGKRGVSEQEPGARLFTMPATVCGSRNSSRQERRGERWKK